MLTVNKQSGFTLLEIMVVVLIIGLFATFIVVNVQDKPHDARIAKVKSDIAVLSQTLETYKLDNFRYPTTEQGLISLVSQPDGEENWKGSYIIKLQNDPWKNPYQYLSPGEHGPYDIFSYGADGEPGGEAEGRDIGNWDDNVAQNSG